MTVRAVPHMPDDGFFEDAPYSSANDAPSAPAPPPRIADVLKPSMLRVRRRCDGTERPIQLPWPTLNDHHFGGGLWPGLHFLNAATGLGKTQMAFQAIAHAANAGVPGLYIGLELGELDLALRVLGDVAKVKWSHLWTGKAGPAIVEAAEKAIPIVDAWPVHYEVARPHGFPASAIQSAIAGMRALYPETGGPGSRPILVIVDFLQLVGDEPGDDQDLRIRIARASYALRACVNDFSCAIVCISSIARERVKLFANIEGTAGLAWDEDANGCPVNRRILDPDAIVGAGKESGEIEYAADSVSVLARASSTWDGTGCDVVFATAKGRATGATWSPLHFSGFGYSECEDRGGRMIEAWQEGGQKRERAKEEKKTAKDEAKLQTIVADANLVRAFVSAHPDCGVNEARVHAVGDNRRRWAAAVAYLGDALVHSESKRGTKTTLRLKGEA